MRCVLPLILLLLAVAIRPVWADDGPARPNILWLSIEDISPDLGCYGDPYAMTPLMDSLAERGIRYTHAFAHAGVCAPARSGIITGMYPTAIGTHNMRCSGIPPAGVKCFTEYLRAAGYYCTNNSKTDYQFTPPTSAWDESSNQAHFRKRPDSDQPFFAVFNFTSPHEGQIRNPARHRRNREVLSPEKQHDPAHAIVPPYYPDTPIVRQDLAHYADNITAVEYEMQRILDQLEEDGLTEDTIIWIWGDHGRGLPRGKRWVYDSGTQVPLIIVVPEKWQSVANPQQPEAVAAGTVTDRLVSFIDFAPTMLSLCGIEPPEHFQGSAFLGKYDAEPRSVVFAHRDRMDERYDLIRSVRNHRFRYIRNFMPHVTYGQRISYMDQMPTMREMRRLHAEGKLSGPEAQYFRETKPVEELFDTELDPHEIHNLADNPAYRETLRALRAECEAYMKAIGDIGLIPEAEFELRERPNQGQVPQTLAPYVAAIEDLDGQRRVTLDCVTPEASLEYRIGNDDVWRLYAQPLTLDADATLRARANRIGFRPSGVTTHRPGDPATEQPEGQVEPHWRDTLDATDLLTRLAELKRLDLASPEVAMPAYRRALEDDDGSVRYWAVVGLMTRTPEGDARVALRPVFEELLSEDDSPIVRITAARALAEQGLADEVVPALIKELEHREEMVRLAALLVLDELGEATRPALPAVRAENDKPGNYTKRVAASILSQFDS